MKYYIFLFFLVIFMLELKNVLSHFCGIHLLKKPKRTLVDQDNESIRSLKEESWESLRIHLDFSMIENNIDKFNKSDVEDLRDKIMPKTKTILEKLLKVKRVNQKLKLPDAPCDNVIVPDNYKSEGVDADIIIFVLIDDTGFYLQNHIEAAAIHCFQDGASRRPIAGYITYKPELKVTNSTALDYMTWLAVHEITHILVMNDSLYEDWIDAKMQPLGLSNVVASKILPNGKSMSVIKTPNVIQQGKDHFNCDKFDGLPLEYNGGPGTAGAHWAKKWMNTDYMIGDSYGENLISKLTLAMFQDSGWYQVDYALANKFLWGGKQGCAFLDPKEKCVEKTQNSIVTKFTDNYCTKLNYPVCSTSNIFRANCRTKRYHSIPLYQQYFGDKTLGGADALTDKCPIPIETKRGQAYYGGSCRVGHTKNINLFEKVCPECACFMANLTSISDPAERKSNMSDKKLRIAQEILAPEIKSSDKFRFKLKQNTTNTNNTINTTNTTTNTTNTTTTNTTNITNTTTTNTTNNSYSNNTEKNNTQTKINSNILRDPLPELNEDDYRSMCFEFECNGGDLFVRILDINYKCDDKNPISIEGLAGVVQCPPVNVLCDKNYLCKFGCTDRYSNSQVENAIQ